ncbi:MAG: hypothetical protein Q8P22_14085 [Chloroflexota bacterium]|nr:hypothetical protein [Chloroflexota bacterium]
MPPADRIRRQLERLAYQRGLGPVPNGYAQWIDQTRHLLIGMFGEDSQETRGFFAAIGDRASGFGLPLHGEWGIWARLERGEAVLQQILERLETQK